MSNDLEFNPGKEPKLIIENGDARAVSYDGSTEFISALTFNRKLKLRDIQFYCGAILNNRFFDQPLVPSEMAWVTRNTEIPIGDVPKAKIVKMMKAEHSRALLEEGRIRLGSIEQYRKSELDEVGDPSEGICVIVAYDGEETHIRHVRGGLNDWIFCCSRGEPDASVMERFGYDSGIEIVDVQGFSRTIGKAVGAIRSTYSCCIYSKDRALYGEVKDKLSIDDMRNGNFGELLGNARAFIKPAHYWHQSEFRFLWRGRERTADYIDVVCPGLGKFCRPI